MISIDLGQVIFRYISVAQHKTGYLTSHIQFDFIDKEARVFSFAQAALKLWTLPRAVINYIDKAADKLIAFLTAIFLIAVLVLIVPAAFVVLLLLSLFLGYCMLVFNYHRSKSFSTFDQLERRDLIELHVKIKHTIKRMQSLKSSRFLFATPMLGSFMKAYYNQLYVL